MAIYGVIMGQGVSVADLAQDTLVTGYGDPEDSLQSCSAVMFANTGTRAGALYHFPAGDINDDAGSQRVLREMRDVVAPTEAYIAYGIVDYMDFMGGPRVTPVDPGNMALRDFVLRLLPEGSRLRRMPANTRIASIRMNGGLSIIGANAPRNIIDLRNRVAGVYPGYRVHAR